MAYRRATRAPLVRVAIDGDRTFLAEHDRHVRLDALMDAWEAALTLGGHSAAMTSTQEDESAQHFYRNRGYVDCGRLLLPDQTPELFLRKELRLGDALGQA